MNFITPECRRELLSLVGLAMEVNRKDFPVFIHFSGHVDKIDIYFYEGEYDKTRKKVQLMDEYICKKYGNPLSAKDVRKFRARFLEASRYKERTSCGVALDRPLTLIKTTHTDIPKTLN